MKIIPVILAGGAGTRLWPLSRRDHPKQFLPLINENTMLQDTILRLNGLDNLADPIIICNDDHRFLVAEQCQQIGMGNSTILLEPVGRNTAPAIAAAALQALAIEGLEFNSQNQLLLVLSADHVIQDIEAFHQAINIAVEQAERGKLVTFGVVPTEANIGYGYIQVKLENDECLVMNVNSFHEKPGLEIAEKYLEINSKLSIKNAPLEYFWNSGMFMFQATTFIDELSKYSPEIVTAVNDAVDLASQDLDFIRLDKQAFESSPGNSIDYALMEKSNNVVVVPLDACWSDIGSWTALYDIGKKDNDGNVVKGDVITQDTIHSYINASHHLVVTLGIKDLIIVDTPNATLIASKDKAHEVNKIVVKLQQAQNSKLITQPSRVNRPWGWYDSVESGEHFQVKKLHVNPGAKLSLQMHRKRAEHWIVIDGIATVTRGEERLILHRGESTYIPLGLTHGLENQTNQPLGIIEVQSGTYLGEDDIVRFEDIYGRINR